MAALQSKTLFFTTSPRSPEKMIPEIKLLTDNQSGEAWDAISQEKFIRTLVESEFFEGTGFPSDMAFSARDRITRAPKALGFVDLSPVIQLTPAGKELVQGKRQEEIFTRQILKFQLPSPYHTEGSKISGIFWIKPYLEIMRLIHDLDGLSFDELKVFALGMTSYKDYENTKGKIINFRNRRHKEGYKKAIDSAWTSEVQQIYEEEITSGKTKTRESSDTSTKKFISTKKRNLRDYADACFRYLRFTDLVSYKGRSLIITPGREEDVSFILSTVDRDPVFVKDEDAYKKYLFDNSIPVLHTDDREALIDKVMRFGQHTKIELLDLSTPKLKDYLNEMIEAKRNAVIDTQKIQLRSFSSYQEVLDTFDVIQDREFYDLPLLLEWNVWRAMVMLNGGDIKGNFKLDDLGSPKSTAPGNMPDIECDYGDFALSVEVTLQSGQRQYESEGESVTRHYGQLLKRSGKETYCLFIAPVINNATIAHFFITNKTDVTYYGGRTKIVPIGLDLFIELLNKSYSHSSRPTPNDIQSLLTNILHEFDKLENEIEWNSRIQLCIDNWLSTGTVNQ